MVVQKITLSNFRNHAESTFEFGDGVNVLLGSNGQGKTNVLEAISYLSLTKSFYAANDVHAVRLGTDEFGVDGSMKLGGGLPAHVHVGYSRVTGEKQFLVNGSRPESLASVIGQFPLVILSPENSAITFGGPGERRRFLDITLSQVSRAYLSDAMEYRRVLRQRNRVLADAKYDGRNVAGIIEPWDDALVHYGSRIASRRQLFISEFEAYVRRAYQSVVNGREEPAIAYHGISVPDGSVEAVASVMREEIPRRRREEESRGSTLVGPHRDDLRLGINGIGLQQHASQGQHKTMLVALKIAEFEYLRKQRNEVPLFLLDDVFSELDAERSARIVDMVSSLGQTVITTTDERVFRNVIAWDGRHRRFYIDQGAVRTAS